MQLSLTTGQIASMVGGRLNGDADTAITALARIEDAGPGSLAFLSNPKYYSHLYSGSPSAVIVLPDFVPEKPVTAVLIHSENPSLAFHILLTMFHEAQLPAAGIDERAVVHPEAVIGKGVYIGPLAVVGKGAVIEDNTRVYANAFIGDGAKVGRGSMIYPGVYVGWGCVLGRSAVLHPGCIIGADGFGFVQDAEGRSTKVPQVGNVVLEDDVELGANTCVDRATLGSTIIRRGVKLDNLVQIGHNCEIGAHTLMAAQVGVAGSTHIGQYCMFGGQSGIVGHIQVADRTYLNGQAAITKDVKVPGQKMRGWPAQEFSKQFKLEVAQRQLPDLLKRVAELEERLAKLAGAAEKQ